MPINLPKLSGLSLTLDDELMLILPHELTADGVSERTPESMLPFLASKDAQASSSIIYRVWRSLMPMKDKEAFANTGMRYDITAMNAGTFRFADSKREYFHTAGHYHESAENPADYPEIYEVLYGRGRWLIQKPAKIPSEISEAYLIEAGAGDKVLVPPGFGHIAINAEDKPLVLANIIAANCQYTYDAFEKLRGGCYRLLAADSSDMIEIEPNPGYRRVPELKKLIPRKDWFKGYFNPLWDAYLSRRDQLAFIFRPETYRQEFFTINNLYNEIK